MGIIYDVPQDGKISYESMSIKVMNKLNGRFKFFIGKTVFKACFKATMFPPFDLLTIFMK